MDNIISLLKSAILDYQSYASVDPTKPTIGQNVIQIRKEVILKHLQNLIELFDDSVLNDQVKSSSLHASTFISKSTNFKFQNLVQCVYNLVSKVVPTFKLIIANDVVVNTSLSYVQLSAYFNCLRTDLQICHCALQLISLLGSDPQFMSSWPYFLMDGLFIDSLISELCQKSTCLLIDNDLVNKTTVVSNINETQKIANAIRNINAKSFILQMMLLSPFSSTSLATDSANSLSKPLTSDVTSILPLYATVNQASIRCIRIIFENVNIHKWFQQQMYASIAPVSQPLESTGRLTKGSSSSHQQQPQQKPHQEHSVGIIGQGRGVRASSLQSKNATTNSNALSSMESKITKSVVKFLRIMFLSMFCLYSDISTSLTQVANLSTVATAAAVGGTATTAQHLLQYTNGSSSSSASLVGKTEITAALLDLFQMFVRQLSLLQVDRSSRCRVMTGDVLAIDELFAASFYIVFSLSTSLLIPLQTSAETNSAIVSKAAAASKQQQQQQEQAKLQARVPPTKLRGSSGGSGGSQHNSADWLALSTYYAAVIDSTTRVQMLCLQWLPTVISSELNGSSYEWVSRAARRGFATFPLKADLAVTAVAPPCSAGNATPTAKQQLPHTYSAQGNWRRKSEETKLYPAHITSAIAQNGTDGDSVDFSGAVAVAMTVAVSSEFSRALVLLCDIPNDTMYVCKSASITHNARLLFTALLASLPALFYIDEANISDTLSVDGCGSDTDTGWEGGNAWWMRSVIVSGLESRHERVLLSSSPALAATTTTTASTHSSSSSSINTNSSSTHTRINPYNLQRILFSYKLVALLTPAVSSERCPAARVLSLAELVTLFLSDCTCALDHQIRTASINCFGLIQPVVWTILNNSYTVEYTSTGNSAQLANAVRVKKVDVPVVGGMSVGETVTNTLIAVSKDSFGSVRDTCFRSLGKIILNGAIQFIPSASSASGDDGMSAINTALTTSSLSQVSTPATDQQRRCENALMRALSCGLLDAKSSVRLQASYALGNMLEKVLPLRRALLMDTASMSSTDGSTREYDNYNIQEQQQQLLPHELMDRLVQRDSNSSTSSTASHHHPDPAATAAGTTTPHDVVDDAWMRDEVWLSFARLVCSMLHGGSDKKTIPSLTRCVGFLGAGLASTPTTASATDSSHTACLLHILHALVLKLLQTSSHINKNKHLESKPSSSSASSSSEDSNALSCALTETLSLSDGLVDESIQQALAQNSKKYIFSLANALTLLVKYQYSLPTRHAVTGSSGGDGKVSEKRKQCLQLLKKLASVFGSLLRYGEPKIQLIASRGLVLLYHTQPVPVTPGAIPAGNDNDDDDNNNDADDDDDRFLQCFENSLLVASSFAERKSGHNHSHSHSHSHTNNRSSTSETVSTAAHKHVRRKDEGHDTTVPAAAVDVPTDSGSSALLDMRRGSLLKRSLLLLLWTLFNNIIHRYRRMRSMAPPESLNNEPPSQQQQPEQHLLSRYLEIFSYHAVQCAEYLEEMSEEAQQTLSPSELALIKESQQQPPSLQSVVAEVAQCVIRLLTCGDTTAHDSEEQTNSLFLYQSMHVDVSSGSGNMSSRSPLTNIPHRAFSLYYSLAMTMSTNTTNHQKSEFSRSDASIVPVSAGSGSGSAISGGSSSSSSSSIVYGMPSLLLVSEEADSDEDEL